MIAMTLVANDLRTKKIGYIKKKNEPTKFALLHHFNLGECTVQKGNISQEIGFFLSLSLLVYCLT